MLLGGALSDELSHEVVQQALAHRRLAGALAERFWVAALVHDELGATVDIAAHDLLIELRVKLHAKMWQERVLHGLHRAVGARPRNDSQG